MSQCPPIMLWGNACACSGHLRSLLNDRAGGIKPPSYKEGLVLDFSVLYKRDRISCYPVMHYVLAHPSTLRGVELTRPCCRRYAQVVAVANEAV